jgi:protocatechuate 3,4-dioxygenase beta subunit
MPPLTPATLTGRLVDEHGTPVAGTGVDLLLVATAGEVSTTTGPDGRYTFDTLPPGDVGVGFTALHGRVQLEHQKASAGEADEFTLSLGTVTTVDETLLPLAALAG